MFFAGPVLAFKRIRRSGFEGRGAMREWTIFAALWNGETRPVRLAYLVEACGGDVMPPRPDLRTTLLRENEQLGSFLEVPACDLDYAEPRER